MLNRLLLTLLFSLFLSCSVYAELTVYNSPLRIREQSGTISSSTIVMIFPDGSVNYGAGIATITFSVSGSTSSGGLSSISIFDKGIFQGNVSSFNTTNDISVSVVGSTATLNVDLSSIHTSTANISLSITALNSSTATLTQGVNGFLLFRPTASAYIDEFNLFKTTSASRLDEWTAFKSTASAYIAEFNIFKTTSSSRLDEWTLFKSTAASKIEKVNLFESTASVQIANLNSSTASLTTSINGLNLFRDTGTVAINNLSNSTTSLNIRLSTSIVETPISPASLAPTLTEGGASVQTGETTTNKLNYDFVSVSSFTRNYYYFEYSPPKGFNGSTVTFRIVWTSTAGTSSQGIVFGLQAVQFRDDDALDAVYGSTATASDIYNGTALDVHTSTMSTSLTIGGTYQAGNHVLWRLTRVYEHVSDTLGSLAQILGVRIYFTRNTITDQ